MPTPRTHARSVSTCEILSLTLIIQDDEYRQTNKAVAPSTAFLECFAWRICHVPMMFRKLVQTRAQTDAMVRS